MRSQASQFKRMVILSPLRPNPLIISFYVLVYFKLVFIGNLFFDFINIILCQILYGLARYFLIFYAFTIIIFY